jgi:hypothetical protein
MANNCWISSIVNLCLNLNVQVAGVVVAGSDWRVVTSNSELEFD